MDTTEWKVRMDNKGCVLLVLNFVWIAMRAFAMNVIRAWFGVQMQVNAYSVC